MPAPHAKVIAGYEAAASELIDQYALISNEATYQHVLPFIIPCPGKAMLDIGAGTGRHAAWFSDLGFSVTAVEPVAAFRLSGRQTYADKGIRWLNDRLPALASLRELDEQFDLITLVAVWHHLTDGEQLVAMRQISGLCKQGGRAILSLRHGAGAPDRPCYDINVEQTLTCARRNGFKCLFQKRAASVQEMNIQRGVEWTWVVLEKSD